MVEGQLLPPRRPKSTWREKLARAWSIAPFQVPLTAYLIWIGVVFTLSAPKFSKELDLEIWTIYNFAAALIAGGFTTLYGRLRENERIESFGLALILLAISIAVILSIIIKDFLGLGDEAYIALGCTMRLWVLTRSRKAERVAIDLVNTANAEEHERNTREEL